MLSTIFRQITIAQFDISGSVDPLLSVTLNKGESLFAESNAMVAMDGTLSLSGRTKGGFFKSLARKFLNDETCFQQKITAEDEGGRALLGNSSGLFVMATEGEGRVAVSGFGSIRRIDIADGQKLIVDNGHLLAWEKSLDYELSINTSRSGLLGKLVSSQTTDEGIVLKFKGPAPAIRAGSSTGCFLRCPRKKPSKTNKSGTKNPPQGNASRAGFLSSGGKIHPITWPLREPDSQRR